MTTQTASRETFQSVAILAGIPVIFVGFIAAIAVVGSWMAFVIFKLYGWFVVPLGAPVLGWWHIYGLLLIYNLITWKTGTKEPKDPSPYTTTAVRVIGIGLVLLIGWLVHLIAF